MIDRKDREFLEALGCVTLEAEPNTLDLIHVGSAITNVLGYAPEDCQRSNFFLSEFVHPDDVESVTGRLALLYEDPRIDLQFRAFRADRQIVHLRGYFALAGAGSGTSESIKGLLWEFRDGSEAESLTKARLQLALDAANMGIWDWNVEESTIFWSEQVYRLHDCTSEELGNLFENYLTLVERIHPEDAEATETGVRTALMTGDDYDIEYRFQIKDGSYRWLQVKGRIYKDDAGNPIRIAGTAQDVTGQKKAELAARDELLERRRAEDELTTLTETLEQRVHERTSELQRMNVLLKDEVAERARTERKLAEANRKLLQSNRELQDFAFVASHDLKEPLRKISTFADLLQSDCSDNLDTDGHFYLLRIQESSSRMMKLIDDLLQFSRVKSKGQIFETIDLNELIADVVSDIEVQVQKANGVIRVDPLPSIEADATQMRQLFQNLLSNAVKFRRNGADPNVHVYAEPPGGSTTEENNACRLIVEDNGIGFDEQYAARIFAPFQRLHQEYEGTGMGLAICRRIVERHRGTIEVSSRPGSGSRFIIELPLGTGERGDGW